MYKFSGKNLYNLILINRIFEYILPTKNITVNEAFEKAKHMIKTFIAIYGAITVECILSDQLPQQHPKSGKFKHIINQVK